MKTRIVTAALLLAAFLSVTFFAPTFIFGALFILIFGLAAWEWARLLKLSDALCIVYAIIVSSLLVGLSLLVELVDCERAGIFRAVIFRTSSQSAVIFWLFIAPWMLVRKPKLTVGRWRNFLLAVGPLIFLACAHALITARSHGIPFVLSLLLIVWLTDTGAYFAGRQWGSSSHRLAPSISPAKTWEGVIGGGLLTLMMAVAAIASPPSQAFAPTLFSAYATSMGGIGALITVTGLIAVSILGDLFESLMKREAGVKDSGALLPGHGGVLDRIDGMIAMLPVAMLLLEAIQNYRG